MIKVGVFDSGIGGLSVANAINAGIDNIEVIYINDKEHLPYGNKSLNQIKAYSWPKIQELISVGCNCIVIACNTLSTNFLPDLKKDFAPIPIIGIVPMVKPASKITKTKIIGVCATPRTLQSSRYKELKSEFASNINVIEPDCSKWASMIENNQLDREQIKKTTQLLVSQNTDVIALGCTHYHWISDLIEQFAGPNIAVIHPEDAIVNRLKSVIKSYQLA